MRVFISSTCYDLIDLRAELETFFREAGATPILSGSLTSEFQVSQDRNSIQTCLTNVQTCDEFVIILSNRYGPTLEKAGFENISATHLEYRVAKQHNKPIHMYVRDRLEADHAFWKKNRDKTNLRLPWCKSSEDWRIFDLLDEHRNIVQTPSHNNWFWIFCDSVELKERLAMDFKATLARVTAQRLFEAGRVPFLDIFGQNLSANRQFISFPLTIRNLSEGIAIRPKLSVERTISQWEIISLGRQEQATINFQWARPPGSALALPLVLSYSIVEGHKFTDQGELTIVLEGPMIGIRYALKERRYSGTVAETQII